MSYDDAADIIEVILRACQQAGLSTVAARTISTEIRARFGGLRVRIPKRGKHLAAQARAAAFADGTSPMSTKEVLAKHGISRSTLYRLLKCGPA